MSFENSNNSAWQVVFQQLPASSQALRALPEASFAQPHYAAALLIPALCVWNKNQTEAVEMINFLKGPQPLSVREIQFISDRLRGKEYLPFSYFNGANPQNGYTPALPYTVTVRAVPASFAEAGYAKLYLQSGGADSPRPVQLRQKATGGDWFLWDQMLLADIRQPAAADPWG